MPETGLELTDFEFSGCDLVHGGPQCVIVRNWQGRTE